MDNDNIHNQSAFNRKLSHYSERNVRKLSKRFTITDLQRGLSKRAQKEAAS